MNDSTPHRDCWVDLAPFTTLAAPAKARDLIQVKSIEQLRTAIIDAQSLGQSFLVLGEGSNTVFVGDYDGVVIINKIKGLQVLNPQSSTTVSLKVSAGENWHRFVTHCVDRGLFGIENLALIPGSVGAAPIQNIGAYGVEVKDVISGVEVFDTSTHEVQLLSNIDCKFAYRESRFKQDWAGKKIVLAVVFDLSSQGSLNLEYPALRHHFDCQPSLKEVYDAVVSIRSEKLPNPKDIPNAGSFFKNPMVDAQQYQKLKEEHPNLVAYKLPHGYKLAAAWLIENAGWKRKEIAGISVHQDQALVLINPNHRSGVAIEEFACAVQKDIIERYNVYLEVEPRLI